MIKNFALNRCIAVAMILGYLMQEVNLMGAIIPVTDANLLRGLSPYNWVCKNDSNSSRVNGASITLKLKGTRQVTLQVAINHLTIQIPTRFPIIAWSVNDGVIQTCQLVANLKEILLSSEVANPQIELYLKGMSPFEDRFTGDLPNHSLKITAFSVDSGGSLILPELSDKIWVNLGDSIMSGDGAASAKKQGRPPADLWPAAEDGCASYGYLPARHYGYREARIAYGGYNRSGGMAGLPALDTLIDQKTSTVSRLQQGKLFPSPDVVLVNLGENGKLAETPVIDVLAKLRSRVNCTTQIFVMIPLSGRARDEVTRSFNHYQESAEDGNTYLIDIGSLKFDTCDGQHPTAAGHQTIYKASIQVFKKILRKPVKLSDQNNFNPPF